MVLRGTTKEKMSFISIKRLHFLANFGYFSRMFWLLQLKALQLIVLEQIIHAVLQKNNAFDQSLYIKLLQYLLPAFRQVLYCRPLSRLTYHLA